MTRAEKKVVKQRLSALQLAEALGNVSEACRRRGMSRSQFYEYKRRFQTHGVVEQILALSMEHPMWGCVRLSRQLMLKGVSVSTPHHSEHSHQERDGLPVRTAFEAGGVGGEGEAHPHARAGGGD